MLKLIFIVSFFMTSASYAGDTDIIPRTVNFLIFISIMYYVLFDKIKAFFANRKNEIKVELEKFQDLLKKSEKDLNELKVELDNMADKASEIVEEAKKEALETTQNYSKLEDVAKTNIQKSYENKLEAEVKHARYETSKEVLGEVMVDLVVSNDTVVKTILKKVG